MRCRASQNAGARRPWPTWPPTCSRSASMYASFRRVIKRTSWRVLTAPERGFWPAVGRQERPSGRGEPELGVSDYEAALHSAIMEMARHSDDAKALTVSLTGLLVRSQAARGLVPRPVDPLGAHVLGLPRRFKGSARVLELLGQAPPGRRASQPCGAWTWRLWPVPRAVPPSSGPAGARAWWLPSTVATPMKPGKAGGGREHGSRSWRRQVTAPSRPLSRTSR